MKPNSRELKALFILSIVAPVGILISLRLTGILQEPITISETITLEAVKWSFERPNHFTYIDEKLNATYSGGALSSTFSVIIGIYDENSVSHLGVDYVTMAVRVNSTVTNPNGFIESLYVVFGKDSQPSLISWVPGYLDFENLSLVGVTSGWTSEENFKEAYVKLAGVGSPERIYFRATTEWSLLTSNNQTHRMELLYELTYYNGTAYKKVTQPFQFSIFVE